MRETFFVLFVNFPKCRRRICCQSFKLNLAKSVPTNGLCCILLLDGRKQTQTVGIIWFGPKTEQVLCFSLKWKFHSDSPVQSLIDSGRSFSSWILVTQDKSFNRSERVCHVHCTSFLLTPSTDRIIRLLSHWLQFFRRSINSVAVERLCAPQRHSLRRRRRRRRQQRSDVPVDRCCRRFCRGANGIWEFN